ncbi:MAG TPA: MarR family transcriptional regulator [Fimbriimonadaceae bacterium]|nr:MarR family transcriptional regulator [Fimbriimonadaceae bacterium]
MPPSKDQESPSKLVKAAQDQFVLEWGRMSSSWGINRTMAQIHALLLVTGRPQSVDDLIERLHISRGNASMNLRDLIDWGIIQRFRRPGDRKDIYISDDDIWHVFSRVVRERKRREIDPTIAAIRDCLAMVPEDDKSEDAVVLRDRLRTLLDVFGLIDLIFDQVFASDEAFRAAIETYNPSARGKAKTSE